MPPKNRKRDSEEILISTSISKRSKNDHMDIISDNTSDQNFSINEKKDEEDDDEEKKDEEDDDEEKKDEEDEEEDDEEDDDDEDDDDEEDDEEDDEDEYDEEEKEKEKMMEKKLKKLDEEAYNMFILVKEELLRNEPDIIKILKEPMKLDDKARLVQLYEIYKNETPNTDDWLTSRDTVNRSYKKFVKNYQEYQQYSELEHEKMKLNASMLINNSHTSLEYTILNLTTSQQNKEIIYRRFKEFKDLKPGDDEYVKMKNWLTWVTEIPHDKIKRFPFSHKKTSLFLKQVAQRFDNELYGMKQVKEQLLIYLNAKIHNPNMKKCNLGLLGPPGVGKCLAYDTSIIMFNGDIKKVQDIVVGDVLMGDDSKPRNVLSLARGREKMYKICQNKGDDYIVNESHILSLKVEKNIEEKIYYETIDISVKDYINLSENEKSFFKGFKVVIDFEECFLFAEPYLFGKWFSSIYMKNIIVDKHISKIYLTNSKKNRLKLLAGIIDSIGCYVYPTFRIYTEHENFKKDVIFLCRSLGFIVEYDNDEYISIFGNNLNDIPVVECEKAVMTEYKDNLLYTSIIVEPMGEDNYYGFTIDGNHRFLLGDFTVTHNTVISRLLASVMDYPFEQISFGGVSNTEFLKGHDYTYVGSQPGEIVKCLKKMKYKNGILFFDEYEKISDNKNICASLLHITDPSQNVEYRDHFLSEITIDLSNIWFIYSMNKLPDDNALRDRIFSIEIPGYNFSDKIIIIQNYLLPKSLENVGLKKDSITIELSAIKYLINQVSTTHDKGVRTIEKAISDLINKIIFLYHNQDKNGNLDEFKISFSIGQKIKYPFRIDKNILDKLIDSKSVNESFNMMYL